MKTLEEGILDDLSFEELESTYENGARENNKPQQPDYSIIRQLENDYRSTEHSSGLGVGDHRQNHDQYQELTICIGKTAGNQRVDSSELRNETFLQYEEFYNWLREERFLERVIDMYKTYAEEDEGICLINDEDELVNYLNYCMKEYTGQKRNFYKYYLQYRKKVKR